MEMHIRVACIGFSNVRIDLTVVKLAMILELNQHSKVKIMAIYRFDVHLKHLYFCYLVSILCHFILQNVKMSERF
jgi:hypothetical protein